MIRKVKITDAKEIAKIYNYHVHNTIVTFDLTPITSEKIATKIKSTIEKHPWFVFEENNKVLGYAYADTWKERSAYDATVESSIYLTQEAIGKGIGKKLYSYLLNELKARNIHIVIGGISLPNNPSIGIHEKFGFKKVAHFEEVGFKFNKWIDVGYWQLKM